MYFSPTNSSLGAIKVAGLTVSEIYSMPVNDSSWFYQYASVNGDQTKLYATKTGSGAT